MIDIRRNEQKFTSQNGEDGILSYLIQKLARPNRRFVEIGCSDGAENNSRNLLKLGMSGTGADINWKKLLKYKKFLHSANLTNQLNLKCAKVTIFNAYEILTWEGIDPDIFSLDIDSYDYFIAEYLLREGYRPSIACLETNTFLGPDPITVEYISNFSRYEMQPDYGLYFGASPHAWRSLWSRYGYRSLGLDSTGTNIFFILPDRLIDSQEEIHEPRDIHQQMFEKKYQKSGGELTQILRSNPGLRYLNIEEIDYRTRFDGLYKHAKTRSDQRATFVTTFTKRTYNEVAHKLIESFDKNWPEKYELLALGENCDIGCPSSRVVAAELEELSYGLKEFKERHRFNPGANGRFGAKYLYVHDCVKWAHKVFAVEAAANNSDCELAIYIDADIVTFQRVPEQFLDRLIPPDADISYMPRKNMYSECSFVIYRLRNPLVRMFIFEHAEAYRSDAVFQLSGWTDCHVFDYLVRKYSNAGALKFWNINDGVPSSSHPFINGPLGEYMDHMKGARKVSGKSYNSDLVVSRTEEYWTSGANSNA
jgi:hypothetical protein